MKYLKKGQLIIIKYLTLNQQKLKKHQFVGLLTSKHKTRLTLTTKIKKQIIELNFDLKSPIVFKIKILKILKTKPFKSKLLNFKKTNKF